MPQYIRYIHYIENYLQLSNDPLVYLRNTPQMEPRIMKTVNELNNAPLELISSQHTLLGISKKKKKTNNDHPSMHNLTKERGMCSSVDI